MAKVGLAEMTKQLERRPPVPKQLNSSAVLAYVFLPCTYYRANNVLPTDTVPANNHFEKIFFTDQTKLLKLDQNR